MGTFGGGCVGGVGLCVVLLECGLVVLMVACVVGMGVCIDESRGAGCWLMGVRMGVPPAEY